MKAVGIIANPFSGKDIRRFTSCAFIVSNDEKENIVERMILSMSKLGIEKIFLMPDTFCLNQNISNRVKKVDQVKSSIEILDYLPQNCPEDTLKAMTLMQAMDIGCMVILGGDGTARLAAKARINVPVIPVSTGTNNVYPYFLEGTSVGCAAAYLCHQGRPEIIPCDKLIDVFINDRFVDVAIVDAVVSRDAYIGSRAIFETDHIDEVIVCRTKADSIGFSAIIGCAQRCSDNDNFGLRTVIDTAGREVMVPIGAGQLLPVRTSEPVKMPLDEPYTCQKRYPGTVALDGERTVTFTQGDILKFMITRKGGLRKVNINKLLSEAIDEGFFQSRNGNCLD